MTPRKMATPQSQSSLWEKSEPQTVPSSIIFFLNFILFYLITKNSSFGTKNPPPAFLLPSDTPQIPLLELPDTLWSKQCSQG